MSQLTPDDGSRHPATLPHRANTPCVDTTSGQLRAWLRPGEELLWYGRPDPRRVLSPSDVFVVPFSLLWCGFAVFWELSVAGGDAPLLMQLWGLPFVAVGLYLVVGRFFHGHFQARRTAYGITSHRAIVVIGTRTSMDTPLTAPTPVTVRRSRRGRHATVAIGTPVPGSRRGPSADGSAGWRSPPESPVTFYDVPDPEPMLRALDRVRAPRE